MRRRAAAGCVALLAAAAGCAPQPPGGDLVGELQHSGVTVSLVLHDGTLTATYRPERAGFHLYSAGLPADGIDGLGRPTVLAAGEGLTATGPAVADREPIVLRQVDLGIDLPVYSDGPVTLTLPVSVFGSRGEAVVGYAACNATQCLPPVSRRPVALAASS